jgi:hypothetical protein
VGSDHLRLARSACHILVGQARRTRPHSPSNAPIPYLRLRRENGDIAVWGGPARFVYHGVAPLKDGQHPLTSTALTSPAPSDGKANFRTARLFVRAGHSNPTRPQVVSLRALLRSVP